MFTLYDFGSITRTFKPVSNFWSLSSDIQNNIE